MTIRASCKTCDSRNRAEIEASRAAGASFATLARNYGGAEATIRRHFRLGHARPAAKPAPAPVTRPAPAPAPARYQSGPTRGSVSLAKVKEAAELLGIPLAELTMCVSEHAACDITVTGDDDEEALYAEFDRADEDAAYVADVARHGTFLAGNVA
ncbi:MAG: hypothetical protein KBB14_06655 [Thermoanaerobaculia bacterium]|nr:hypothetical protein [Thermoanaerobaculia bacterium]